MTSTDEQMKRLTETRNRGVTPDGWDVRRTSSRARLFETRENLDLSDPRNRNSLCDVADISLAAPTGWQLRGVNLRATLDENARYEACYMRNSDGYSVEVSGSTPGGAVVAALTVVSNTPADNSPTLFGEDLYD